MNSSIHYLSLAFIALLLSSCIKQPIAPGENPYPVGTLQHFQAQESYQKTHDSWIDQEAYDKLLPSESELLISLSNQRALLKQGDKVIIDYPISTGKKEYETPPGTYKVLEKMKDKESNIYGTIVDKDGLPVKRSADIREDIPDEEKGEKMVFAKLPYWIRFTWDGIGHHIGRVARYPASHGCVRGPAQMLPKVFEKVQIGTKVTIVE